MATYWYGNSISSKWRAYAFYNTSSSNTTYTITISGGFQSQGWGFDLSGVPCTLNIGSYSKSGTASVSTSSGETKNVRIVSDLSHTYTKTHSAQTITLKTTVNRSSASYYGGTSTGSTTITIPALASYTVAFNANGGSGAPSSQTKWYGETLTLSSTKPTRTGFTFQGWATSSSATTATYSAGGSYTANSGTTLYAVWKANTYTVAFNANGGSGAPSSQTKTYGVTLTLSSTVPSRVGYDFLGWGTSAGATTATYQPGGSYTANAATTLYAVWKVAYSNPTVSISSLVRCQQDGTADDEGTYAKLTMGYSVDATDSGTVSAVSYQWMVKGGSYSSAIALPFTSGSTGETITEVLLSTETDPFSIANAYYVKVTVTDTHGLTSTATNFVSPAAFTLDFLQGGQGMAIGKACDSAGLHVAWDADFDGNVDMGPRLRMYSPMSNMAGVDTVSSNTPFRSINAYDKDGRLTAYTEAMREPSDRIYLSHAVRRRKSDGTEVTNAMYMGVAADGTRDVSVTDATAWRNALGASSGVWTAAMIPALARTSKLSDGVVAGTAIFSGLSIAKGGTIGTSTNIFKARLFYIGLSSGYCIGYRTGDTSNAGTIRGIGGADNGSKTYVYVCQIAVTAAGKCTLTAASSHVLSLTSMEATALNLTSIYPLW